jgi:predicted transcriptional regulator
MEVLWRRNSAATAREVSRVLATDRDLAHTTVMTVLDRLAKKGFLARERDGRAWRYRPIESREAYVAELMLGALDMTGDRDAALAHFARSVTGDEAGVLRRVLDEVTRLDEVALVDGADGESPG